MGRKNKSMQRRISCDKKIESDVKRAVKRRLKSFPRLFPIDTKQMPTIFARIPTEAIAMDEYPSITNTYSLRVSSGTLASLVVLDPFCSKL